MFDRRKDRTGERNVRFYGGSRETLEYLAKCCPSKQQLALAKSAFA